MKTILVTGSEGFIGSSLSLQLLKQNYNIVGLDNHNDYYDTNLKTSRLLRHLQHQNYTHILCDISDRSSLDKIFNSYKFDMVIHLAAQAGVRYSIESPSTYLDSNIVGFGNVINNCQKCGIKYFLYASSSSVYGSNKEMPYSINDRVDAPLSLYAATKQSNELIASAYSHLYDIETIGLRFFTVYGPWDRPDMALQKFMLSILMGEDIMVYNYGNHSRDFTYIDDITDGILRLVCSCFKEEKQRKKVYNLGSSKPIKLTKYIKTLEKAIGMQANIRYLPQQAGDVLDTFADIKESSEDFGYNPKINLHDGIQSFVDWYMSYYNPVIK